MFDTDRSGAKCGRQGKRRDNSAYRSCGSGVRQGSARQTVEIERAVRLKVTGGVAAGITVVLGLPRVWPRLAPRLRESYSPYKLSRFTSARIFPLAASMRL